MKYLQEIEEKLATKKVSQVVRYERHYTRYIMRSQNVDTTDMPILDRFKIQALLILSDSIVSIDLQKTIYNLSDAVHTYILNQAKELNILKKFNTVSADNFCKNIDLINVCIHYALKYDTQSEEMRTNILSAIAEKYLK